MNEETGSLLKYALNGVVGKVGKVRCRHLPECPPIATYEK
jgi:hypothetical protein